MTTLDRIPPQARELEEAIIGAMLIERDAIHALTDVLTPEAFYDDRNATIYRAIMAVHNSGMGVDLLTVGEYLRKHGQSEQVGGISHLSDLTSRVASTANVRQHAYIVKEKHIQRELARLAHELADKSYRDTTDVFDLLDDTTLKLYNIANQIVAQNIKSAAQVKAAIAKDIVDIKAGIKTSGLIPTSLPWIKLQRGTVTVIGAKPGTGKTAFITSSARDQSDMGYAVGIKSVEMTDAKLTARLLQQDTGISAKRLIHADITGDEFDRFTETNVPERVYIDDTPKVTQDNLRNQIVAFIVKHKCEVIYIDYFQKIVLTGKKSTTDNQFDAFENICAIAKEYNVAVCVLSQLKRGNDDDSDLLESLRGGGIEQGASEVYVFQDKHKKENKDRAWGEIPENRRGLIACECVKNRDEDYIGGDIYFDKPRQRMTAWENRPGGVEEKSVKNDTFDVF